MIKARSRSNIKKALSRCGIAIGAAFAGSQAASADIVLDLNHDGVTDFTLHQQPGVDLTISGPLGNAVMSDGAFAAALNFGALLSGPFTDVASGVPMMTVSPPMGPWDGVSERYLGLEFTVGSETYLGWAFMDVSAIDATPTLRAIAYESIAGAMARAGHTNPGYVETIIPEPSSLSLDLLALGAVGLLAWRCRQRGV